MFEINFSGGKKMWGQKKLGGNCPRMLPVARGLSDTSQIPWINRIAAIGVAREGPKGPCPKIFGKHSHFVL